VEIMENSEYQELLIKANSGDLEAQNALGNLLTDEDSKYLNYEEGIKWYLKAAEAGFSKSQYNLGVSYKEGIGVEKDIKKAIYWYEKAAEQNDVDALFALGNIYSNETLDVYDLEKAKIYYLKGAELDDAYCAFYYGSIIVDENSLEAKKWLLKGIDNFNIEDNPKTYGTMTGFYGNKAFIESQTEEEQNEAIKYIKIAAEYGENNCKAFLYSISNEIDVGLTKEKLHEYYMDAVNAGVNLAVYRYFLDNIEENKKQLSNQELIEKLLEIANSKYCLYQAYVELGKVYIKEKNYDEAIKWFTEGMKNDNKDAYFEMAKLLLQVHDGSKAATENLILLLEKAHSLGHEYAGQYLGYIYYDIVKDKNKALIYLKDCVQKGNVEVINYLLKKAIIENNITDSLYYYELINPSNPEILRPISKFYRISKNYLKYLETVQKLVDLGDKKALVDLAKIYMEGIGINQDYHKAYDILVSIPDEPEALFLLGKFYENGYIGPVDYEKAVAYYSKSSSLNYQEAYFELKKFKKNIFGKWKKIG